MTAPKWGPLQSGTMPLCPVAPRHGALMLKRNAAGGLIAICAKCYVPAKGRKNLLEVK